MHVDRYYNPNEYSWFYQGAYSSRERLRPTSYAYFDIFLLNGEFTTQDYGSFDLSDFQYAGFAFSGRRRDGSFNILNLNFSATWSNSLPNQTERVRINSNVTIKLVWRLENESVEYFYLDSGRIHPDTGDFFIFFHPGEPPQGPMPSSQQRHIDNKDIWTDT